jgi:hypothetical protein
MGAFPGAQPVDLKLAGLPAMSGVIQPAGMGYIRFIDDNTGAFTAVPVKADGKFTLNGVSPGRYRVWLDLSDRFWMKQVLADGLQAADAVIEVTGDHAPRLEIASGRGAGPTPRFCARIWSA